VVPTGIEAGAFTSFTRTDGMPQAAYKGRPLYTFTGDAKPGDTSGNGFNGKWFAVDASAQ
jgi:predicted lipoprotein with Yx(FWY)xxD motif